MREKLFVIVGEYGEYESRESLVCGIFKTKKAAEAAVAEHAIRRDAHDKWSAAYRAHYPSLPFLYFRFPLQGPQIEEHKALDASARAAAGPEPEYELAETVEIYEIELDAWYSRQRDPRRPIPK